MLINSNIRQEKDDTIMLLNYYIDTLERDLNKTIQTILDLGSSNGYYHQYIKPDKQLRIIGIDNNINQLKIENTRSVILQWNLEKYPYPIKEKFDLVIMMEILQYIYDIEYFLKYVIQHHTKTGTVLFITVPNKKSLDDIINNVDLSVYDPELMNTTYGRWNKYYIRYFDFNSFYKLLKQFDNKINILDITGCNCLATPTFNSAIHYLANTLNLDISIITRLIGNAFSFIAPNIVALLEVK